VVSRLTGITIVADAPECGTYTTRVDTRGEKAVRSSRGVASSIEIQDPEPGWPNSVSTTILTVVGDKYTAAEFGDRSLQLPLVTKSFP
jgi:hypothetical protein